MSSNVLMLKSRKPFPVCKKSELLSYSFHFFLLSFTYLSVLSISSIAFLMLILYCSERGIIKKERSGSTKNYLFIKFLSERSSFFYQLNHVFSCSTMAALFLHIINNKEIAFLYLYWCFHVYFHKEQFFPLYLAI